MLLIQTWGGIGDILRELSALPHAALHRRLGLRWKVLHIPPESLPLHPGALVPAADFARQLVARCPSLVWGGEGNWSNKDKAYQRIFRFLAARFTVSSLFAPGIRLTDEEQAGLPAMDSALKIGLQTHLLGLPSKQWDSAKWATVVQGCLTVYPQATLYILDPAEQAQEFAINERVIWCGRLNIPQAVRVVEQLDLLVSIDSWAKYPAAWAGVPQVIIVPDQTSDYRELDAEAVWTHSLRGIAGKPKVKLIGLEKTAGTARYTLDQISDLSSEDVLKAMSGLRVTSRE